nr:coiled-coil domain-containing protein 187 isoform X1 [Misgurnus anguillicaudatus]XP_055044008.1 coiled-coil domain-containing protein 187 isoform X1 [Misgurnus anguillicaudatus]
MMAELEVDQSNLPRVQEVCQCFAVLEDGALAHNLQEQEIEQHYTSNIQRNQLVQKDIRVAKSLQDEEKHTALLLQQQATRQLEERDSEYARMIQEEIRRRAEEARRREVEDEEIAKRIQEEEELRVRNRGSYHNRDGRETTSLPPYSPRSVHPSVDRHYNRSPTRRWQRSLSPPYSDSEEDLIDHRRPTVVPNSSQAYQDSRSTVGQRIMGRTHLDQDNSSTTSQSDSTVSQRSRTSHLSGGWGDVIKVIKTDLNEQGYLSHSSEDELFEPIYRLEKMLKQKQRSNRGTRLSRHSSVREDHSRTWHGDGFSRVESFRGGERHVRFQDERRRTNSYHGNGYSSNENGHDARERGDVGILSPGVLRGNHAQPRESLGDQIPTQGFRRNVSMRRSYQGDVRLSKRTSVRGERRTSNQNDLNLVSRVRPSCNTHLMEMEERRPDPLREAGRWEADRNQRQRGGPLTEERIIDTHYPRQHRARRSQSEHLWRFEEERSSSDEELEREMRRMQRHPSHSTRSPRAGPVAGRSGMAALDLGELEQVLLDEELARRLQEEEVKLAEEQGSSPRQTCPRDFRLAQVAQDEEIARFIQKQEIKAKRRSAELDPVGPGRGYRNMVTEYDRRELQRERMGSDGLHSPVDDFTTDHQLSSPVSMATQPQSVRNIAEELDPTFQRQEMADAGLRINGPQQVDSSNPAEEQPSFVPPTKRQNEKLGRAKPKDKKENIKQKENCKQQ